MTGPTDFERLRQSMRLEVDAGNFLTATRDAQNQRWQLLREVIDNAGDEYSATRLNIVEERFRDQGAPLWLSFVINAAVTFIPVTSLSTGLLLSLTHTVQKVVTSADRKLAVSQVMTLYRRDLTPAGRGGAYKSFMDISAQIKQTEEMVAAFAKKRDPELSNTMQNGALALGEALVKQPFAPIGQGRRLPQTPHSPLVAVKDGLKGWIRSGNRVEAKADAIIRERLSALSAIASSPAPAEEAKAREAEAREREATREPRVPFRQPVETLPKTNKDALDQLTQARDELAFTSLEKQHIPDPDDLWELQLMIEAIIWVATYDFTPRRVQIETQRIGPDAPIYVHSKQYTVNPAPLPDGLWPKLIRRFKDLERLGTGGNPEATKPPVPMNLSAELRLSYYFSQVLYPKVRDEGYAWIRQVR